MSTSVATVVDIPGITKDEVTIDARVQSIVKFESQGRLELQLRDVRAEQISLRANIEVTTIGDLAWNAAQTLTPESLVRVVGLLHLGSHESKAEDEQIERLYSNNEDYAALGISYEITLNNLKIIALASRDFTPLSDDRSKLGLDERLQHRILDVRNAASGAMFKLHSGMCQLIVEFLGSNDFHWIHTPRIITATIPGDKEYFHLPYFGRDAWLAQSTQHHKQMALSMDMNRVFEIGPVFRAEVKSSTSARHMTEFTVLDIGMIFQDDYHEVTDMIESMLLFVFKGLQERKQYSRLIEILKKHYGSMKQFHIGFDKNGKVPRITFVEAKRILREELGLETDDQQNFTPQEEAALGKYFRTSSHLGQTDMFTIDKYPASMRQFNSQANSEAPGFSNTWDIIVRGREICSGSQRINSYEEVCDAMRAGLCGQPLDPEDERWQPYLNAFRAGMPPHGGCGLGVNRLLQGFLGLDDVREVTLFPRDVKRLVP